MKNKGLLKNIRRKALIEQLAKHDETVFEFEMEGLVKFANEQGFDSIRDYYSSLSDERINHIANDYFAEFEAI